VSVARDQRDRRRQERQQVDDAEAGAGVFEPRRAGGYVAQGMPDHTPIRAAYSSANAITAAISMVGDSQSILASNSGTDAKIIASTSMTMMAMISLTKREPAECGR